MEDLRDRSRDGTLKLLERRQQNSGPVTRDALKGVRGITTDAKSSTGFFFATALLILLHIFGVVVTWFPNAELLSCSPLKRVYMLNGISLRWSYSGCWVL